MGILGHIESKLKQPGDDAVRVFRPLINASQAEEGGRDAARVGRHTVDFEPFFQLLEGRKRLRHGPRVSGDRGLPPVYGTVRPGDSSRLYG